MIEQAGLFEIDRQLKEANKHIEDAEVPWDDLYFKFSELAARYHALGMTVATIIHEKQEQAMSLIDLIKSNLSEHGIDLDGESEDWPEILEEALKRE